VGKDAVHRDPVWRERADFLIAVNLPEERRAEQLFARRVDERRFELCCIPFFSYGLALGDVVETDDDFNVIGVHEASGRKVLRVWFGEATIEPSEITRELAERGAQMEWSSENLLAIDAQDASHAASLSSYLNKQADAFGLIVEPGD
jgi:hypothetical protein